MKRIFLMIMIISIVFNFNVFAAVELKDIYDHWAEDQIKQAVQLNLIKGYQDATFRPNNPISRAEMVTIVNGAFKFTEKAELKFSDVYTTDWYYDSISRAIAKGYLKGYTDNTMKPKNFVTRQEAAVMFQKILNLTDNAALARQFRDSDKIGSWAIAAIGAVSEHGVMKGRPNNIIAPLDTITRAETVSLILRAIEFTK